MNHDGRQRNAAADIADTQETPPLVSVIIPAYNVGEFIGETLASVFAQQFRSFEVVVVNDGSPDTPVLEVALMPYADRIRVITQANGGPSAERNAGIDLAHGEYIALLDGDDVWSPECLGELVATAHSDLSAAVVHGDAEIIGDTRTSRKTLRERNRDTISATASEASFSDIATRRYTIATSCSMIRRDWLLRAGKFDVALRRSEDYDLWLRIAHLGGRFKATDRVLMKYRRRSGSASHDPTDMLNASLHVLDKCQVSLDLTPEESESVRIARRRQLAERRLIESKRAIANGEFTEARRAVEEANAELRSPKLTLISYALAFAPNVLSLLYAMTRSRPPRDV